MVNCVVVVVAVVVGGAIASVLGIGPPCLSVVRLVGPLSTGGMKSVRDVVERIAGTSPMLSTIKCRRVREEAIQSPERTVLAYPRHGDSQPMVAAVVFDLKTGNTRLCAQAQSRTC